MGEWQAIVNGMDSGILNNVMLFTIPESIPSIYYLQG